MTDEAMTKARFLGKLRAERRQWEAAIAAIGEERMTLPGFAGVWSVRDVVAHITAYERWMLEHIEAEERSETSAPSVLDGADMERRNLAAHELTRGLSLDEVRAEAQRVWEGLLQVAEKTPEDELLDVRRAPTFVKTIWGDGVALWEAIANLAYEHYQEHLPNFQAWNGEKASSSLTLRTGSSPTDARFTAAADATTPRRACPAH